MSARLAAAAVSTMGRILCCVASTTASQAATPSLRRCLDLHDKDHRIPDQDADQRQNAEDSDEPERCPAWQHGGNDTNETKRGNGNHEEETLEAL